MKTILLILFPFILNAQFKEDKLLHYGTAAVTTIVVGEFVYHLTDLEGVSSLVGTGFGLLLTFGKEFFWDGYLGKGTKSNEDLFAGGMGAFQGGLGHRISIDLRDKKKTKEYKKFKKSLQFLN
jgi:hypothetical protein